MLKRRFFTASLLVGFVLCGIVHGDGGLEGARPSALPPPPQEVCRDGFDVAPPGGRMPQYLRRYFEHLKQENPDEFKRLMELRVTNQEEFLKEIKKAIPPRDHEMRRRRFDLDRKCFQLSVQLREATDEAEKKRLSAELDAAIDESLALVLKQAEAQMVELQKFIDQLKNDREKLRQERRKFFLEARPPKGPPPEERPPKP